MRACLALLAVCSCSQRTDLLPRSIASAGCSAPIRLGDECAGAAAARRLRYALCSCSSLILGRGLFTEGGSGMLGAPPAAVGANDYIQVAGVATVAGVLAGGGLDGVAFGRQATVLGSLRSAGTLVSNQFLSVGGDAFVDGDVLGRMDIGGTLHVPVGSAVSAGVGANGLAVGPVEVDPPCDCGGIPNLTSLISAHKELNDNAAVPLGPDALLTGQTQLDLPCGEFYLSNVKMPPGTELELRVHGRAALYVGGDVYLGDGMRVTLDPKAELDLIVGGNFSVEAGDVGAPETSLVRLWLGGMIVRLGPAATLSASVYAPVSLLLADDDLRVNGALLTGDLSARGDVRMHFDASILSAGVSCGEMPQSSVE